MYVIQVHLCPFRVYLVHPQIKNKNELYEFCCAFIFIITNHSWESPARVHAFTGNLYTYIGTFVFINESH